MSDQRTEEGSSHPTVGSADNNRGLGALLRKLGPGLITGAADDDPSGIATYSQAGAAFGFGTLWTALVSLPLMASVQLMCARIGVVSKHGFASTLRTHYSPIILWFACSLLVVGNVLNIAADLGGMAAAATLLTGVHQAVFVPIFAIIIVLLLVYSSYDSLVSIFKWLTLVLFAYVISSVLARPDWLLVVKSTVIPHIIWSKDYLFTFVAILGTTISPYLFFWQAAQSAEQLGQVRKTFPRRKKRSLERELNDAELDSNTGMFISNAIMYFIIITAGATLHRAGVTDVQSAAQAAQALQPVAGAGAKWVFAIGIIGTGMLGVPVLAGSAAYAVTEGASWKHGMDERPETAKQFYGVIIISMILGMGFALAKINAIKLLVISAVVNGVLAPPLILLLLIICNNHRIMGKHKNGVGLNVLGGLTATLMTAASIALLVSLMST